MGIIEKLKSDNQGSTLLEVIVSVLIVGIVFVPLMVGLNAALNINKDNEKQLYAENVAQNVVEVCKTYGANGLVKMATATEDDNKIGSIFTGATLGIENASNTEFKINGITSGTGKTFEAVISFDTTPYDPDPAVTPPVDGSPLPAKQNDFSDYPSLAAVSNASMITLGDNDLDNIVSYFYSVAASFETELDESDMKDNIDQWLKRRIEITIEQPGTGEPDEGRFVVKKQVIYSAVNFSIDGKGELFHKSGYHEEDHLLEIYTDPNDIKVGSYASIPGNIILTYKPMKNSLGVPKKLKNDTIVLNKEVNGGVNLYSLCENGSALKASGWQVRCEATGTDLTLPTPEPDTNTYRVKVFSNVNMLPYGVKQLESFGGGLTGKQNKMKDVTVTVSDGVTTISKTSTVIEFE